ncbi:1,5-anhydro-D-fructose reductase-like isoform X1 [Schistocerca gregaria]|uniref:1,5-anhydro-D-fructose reductase-like isoform X1 n=1 Tax=Schistocerca gregaria TaxID=7010 RepID=UPI00211E935D|nr:1,5-anhydro-D-fructose reductase-like isoform X1 [Schistocerca gregaria]
MTGKMEYLTFFNGHKMPILGLGTAHALGDDVEKAIDAALEIGYRHIDTARRYNNEAQIGRTLKKWLDSGKIKREDLFIVTKLPLTGNRAECVEKHLKQSLHDLQLDYVDLYLIHHPVGFQDVDLKDNGEEMVLDMNTDHVNLWKAMEDQVDVGRARSIGLSNFNARQVKRVWQSARIRPANLQVELHAYFQQAELRAFCRALDVTVCAYIPLGAPGVRPPGRATIPVDASQLPKRDQMTNPVVSQIAQKHGKTNAQVLLRYIIQLGVAAIPKSTNPDRLRQNFDVFDFELSVEDMDALEQLDKGPAGRQVRAFIPEMANHPEYPFNAHY